MGFFSIFVLFGVFRFLVVWVGEEGGGVGC